jgi:hypothetical protein
MLIEAVAEAASQSMEEKSISLFLPPHLTGANAWQVLSVVEYWRLEEPMFVHTGSLIAKLHKAFNPRERTSSSLFINC